MKQWRTGLGVVGIVAVAVLSGGMLGWAQEEGRSYPQGPGLAPGPGAAPLGVSGYQPIPNSMLPLNAVSPASKVGVQQAALPSTTNLGGLPTMGHYTLGTDDVVYISVQNQPEFSGQYVIGHNGTIQYGFVGDVPAVGLTKEELAERITEYVKEYIRSPSVYVVITAFNSKAIYIFGMVSRPGKYAMRGDSIKIREALIAAGLNTQHAALKRVHIIKSDPTDPTHRKINVKDVVFKGKTKHNIDLIDGDIVVVPSTVWGSVNKFIGNLLSPVRSARTVTRLGALAF